MLRLERIYSIIFLITVLLSVPSCENVEKTGNDMSNETESVNVPEKKGGEFVILFTNDFHSQIDPIDMNASYNADRGGIKRIKVLVDSVRKAEPAVLLADAGDFVQGTYYFSLLNGVVESIILDELDYDVRTIGNHEFDKKMTGLGDMLSMSRVPVVATNYDFSRTNVSGYIKSSIILDAGNVKVGFIGLNVRLQNLVDPTACEGVEWQDAINIADNEAEKLRSQGADIVIALSHLGYQKDSDAFYYDRGIAMRTRHIDMIIGGHTHTFLNSADYVTNADGDKVPIVQTGSKGICLGYAKIKVSEEGKPTFTYKLIPVKSHLDSKVDAAFSDMIDTYSATVTEKMSEVIGYCPQNLWKGSPESPLGNLTADGLIWMAREYYDVDADVSLYNSGGIRSSIYKGDLTLGDVYSVYPFDNVLTILTLKGKDLNSLFDYVASNGGMPVNKGVKLVISNGKVKSLTINGQPVDEEQTYTIATIDYLANLGRYGLDKAMTRNDSPDIIRDYFGEYFRYLADRDPNNEIRAYTDGRIIINE